MGVEVEWLSVEDLDLGSRTAKDSDETNYMRKLIRAAMAGTMLAGLGIGLAGCTSEESGVKTETQIKGPGGTTTLTEKQSVKTSGENPPAVPGDAKP
jgi:hypothetical protein